MLHNTPISTMTIDNGWKIINEQKEGGTLIPRKPPPLSLENPCIFLLPIYLNRSFFSTISF